MSRVHNVVAPAVTVITLAALCILLFADEGWRSDLRWTLVGLAALFVAVAWSQVVALARQGSVQAAKVLLWSTLAATTYFLVFAAALMGG